jgi:hypothetical protein
MLQPIPDVPPNQTRLVTQASLLRLQEREHPMCIVCSPHNPNGLKLRFAVQADGSVLAVFDSLPALQSYPNVLQGGVIATILDSAMVYALFATDIVAVTATIEVRYRAPTVTGRFAVVRGWTESAKAGDRERPSQLDHADTHAPSLRRGRCPRHSLRAPLSQASIRSSCERFSARPR